MPEFINQFQERVKVSTSQIFLLLLKVISGLIVGLTLALIGQELIGYGTFSFLLVMVVVTLTLMRIVRHWSWGRLLVFDLICILMALLLRMYILIAPGA